MRSLLVLLLVFPAACGGDDSADADAGISPDASLPQARGEFPKDFLWGTAMAPYQVEGNLHGTDWFQWESTCSGCSGDSADDGPNFWELYAGDLDHAASISNNALRIGIDWSRLFPTPEAHLQRDADPAALQRYHDIITAARDRGLNVMVTLVHFALPTWLHNLENQSEQSGWEDDNIVTRFAEFAGWAAAEFGTDVDYWITINEPMVQVTAGWIAGESPPGKTFEIETAFEVAETMINAHARAYDAIHQSDLFDADGDGEAARVSISKHNRVFLPKDSKDPDHVGAADMLRYLFNELFLDAVVFGKLDRNYDFDYDDEGDVTDDDSLKGRLDFIGLNYYGVTLVIPTANDNNFPLIGLPLANDLDIQGFNGPISDFGWSIYPQGLRTVLDDLEVYDRPIIITENGVADANDTVRPRFLVSHLYGLNQAIDDGVDIEGYFHWTLIDNFEWGSGYCPRFGLFHVDFDDEARARTMGEGAAVYKRIIDANTVDPALFGEYPEYQSQTTCPRVGL